MKINLTAIFDHPSAIRNKTRYARVDNTNTPLFIQGPDVITSPATISPIGGVDNGQWRIGITPVYADQRVCEETFYDTPPCIGVNSFNAIVEGANIVITYNAPGEIPKVKWLIAYPSGGSAYGVVTNGSNNSTITVPMPTGINGNVSVYIQTVCDEETSFFSQLSQPVVIDYQDTTMVNATLDVLCDSYVGPNPTTPGSGAARLLSYHKLRFNLAQALPSPLTVDLAFNLVANPPYTCQSTTWGGDILPNGMYEKGLFCIVNYNLPYRITIPAGVTQFTTNTLEFAASAAPPYTEVIPCRDNANPYDYASEKIFAKIYNNVNNVTLNITSITNSNTYPTTFQQIP